MIKNLSRLTLGTTLALSTIVLSTSIAHSATVTQNILVDIDSGPLLGNSYTGFVSYDDASVTPSFTGTLPITDFSFTFQSTIYDETSDPGATVSFDNGSFLGLDFAVVTPPQPTFISGSVSLSEAFFSYVIDPNVAGQAGTGVITYTNAIPEPSSVLGLGLFASLALIRRLSLRAKV